VREVVATAAQGTSAEAPPSRSRPSRRFAVATAPIAPRRRTGRLAAGMDGTENTGAGVGLLAGLFAGWGRPVPTRRNPSEGTRKRLRASASRKHLLVGEPNRARRVDFMSAPPALPSGRP